MEEKNKTFWDKHKWTIIIFGLFGLILLILPWLLAKHYSGIVFSNTGPIGDTIGGITAPFIGFFAAILVYLAFRAQIDANNNIQLQFEEQRKVDYRTNFESTFFNLLNIHHDIVKNIDFEPHKIIENNNDLINYFVNNRSGIEDIEKQLLINSNKATLTSRDVFKYAVTFLYNLLETDLFSNKFADNIEMQGNLGRKLGSDFNNLQQFWDDTITTSQKTDITKFNTIFQYTYHRLSTDFGHYFRNLYRIIKMVDEKKFHADEVENFKIQYSYTSIIRAQLSDDEIKLIFFNCLFRNGLKKFKPLVEKYTLLKIIDTDNPVYGFYAKFYLETAIKKHDENNIKDHLKHFAK